MQMAVAGDVVVEWANMGDEFVTVGSAGSKGGRVDTRGALRKCRARPWGLVWLRSGTGTTLRVPKGS